MNRVASLIEVEEQYARAVKREEKLTQELLAANAHIGKLLCVLKGARADCMHPGSLRARQLDEAIHSVEEGWQPAKTATREPWPAKGPVRK